MVMQNEPFKFDILSQKYLFWLQIEKLIINIELDALLRLVLVFSWFLTIKKNIDSIGARSFLKTNLALFVLFSILLQTTKSPIEIHFLPAHFFVRMRPHNHTILSDSKWILLIYHRLSFLQSHDWVSIKKDTVGFTEWNRTPIMLLVNIEWLLCICVFVLKKTQFPFKFFHLFSNSVNLLLILKNHKLHFLSSVWVESLDMFF